MKKAHMALLALVLATTGWTQPNETTVIRGGRILTVTNGIVEKGSILIENDKITALGTDIEIPDHARVIEAAGTVVTPGLIDSHSHLGLGPSGGVTEDNEMSDPSTPQLRIIDSIHPEGMPPHWGSFKDAVSEGVTTIIARPGSGNVIGGLSAALKLTGKTVDEMVLAFPVDMKMAMGKKGYYASKGRLPVTRMGTAYIVRQAMVDAKQYQDSWKRYEEKKKTDQRLDEVLERYRSHIYTRYEWGEASVFKGKALVSDVFDDGRFTYIRVVPDHRGVQGRRI